MAPVPGTGAGSGAAPPVQPWQRATVLALRDETARAKSIRLGLAAPLEYLAGQHVVVRLTAPDGYRAQRSYSIASAPDGSSELELTVERLEGGEVSTFLHDELAVGDELELRGPIGGFFVWRAETPALLVGGGSGVVPLMAMLRLGRRLGRSSLVRLVVSVRSPADLYYASELPGPESTVVYTRAAPTGLQAARALGHLRAEDLAAVLLEGATAYVCGSAVFADVASRLLLEIGVEPASIRVERFGPTG
jgi:ferredoxin-NADP reductase